MAEAQQMRIIKKEYEEYHGNNNDTSGMTNTLAEHPSELELELEDCLQVDPVHKWFILYAFTCYLYAFGKCVTAVKNFFENTQLHMHILTLIRYIKEPVLHCKK